jgi:hypothetical protein
LYKKFTRYLGSSYRIYDKDRIVLAVNEVALSRGYEVGKACVIVGDPKQHMKFFRREF